MGNTIEKVLSENPCTSKKEPDVLSVIKPTTDSIVHERHEIVPGDLFINSEPGVFRKTRISTCPFTNKADRYHRQFKTKLAVIEKKRETVRKAKTVNLGRPLTSYYLYLKKDCSTLKKAILSNRSSRAGILGQLRSNENTPKNIDNHTPKNMEISTPLAGQRTTNDEIQQYQAKEQKAEPDNISVQVHEVYESKNNDETLEISPIETDELTSKLRQIDSAVLDSPDTHPTAANKKASPNLKIEPRKSARPQLLNNESNDSNGSSENIKMELIDKTITIEGSLSGSLGLI